MSNRPVTQSSHLTHSPIHEEVGDSATVVPPIVEEVTWPQLVHARERHVYFRVVFVATLAIASGQTQLEIREGPAVALFVLFYSHEKLSEFEKARQGKKPTKKKEKLDLNGIRYWSASIWERQSRERKKYVNRGAVAAGIKWKQHAVLIMRDRL